MKMQTSHSLRHHGTEQEVRFTVSNMSLVTVLVTVMVYLRLDSNQRVYLRRLDSNLLIGL